MWSGGLEDVERWSVGYGEVVMRLRRGSLENVNRWYRGYEEVV